MQAAREPGVPTTIPRVKLTRMAETGRSGDADHGGPGAPNARISGSAVSRRVTCECPLLFVAPNVDLYCLVVAS